MPTNSRAWWEDLDYNLTPEQQREVDKLAERVAQKMREYNDKQGH